MAGRSHPLGSIVLCYLWVVSLSWPFSSAPSLLLLFIRDSEHLWLLFSPYEHYCPAHPKIAKPNHLVIPTPGQSKQGGQGLRALLPVPLSPAVSTSPTLVGASSRFMSWLLLQQLQILPDKSLWSCQHRQRSGWAESSEKQLQTPDLSPSLAPRVPPWPSKWRGGRCVGFLIYLFGWFGFVFPMRDLDAKGVASNVPSLLYLW